MIVSCVGVSLGYNLCAGLLRAVGDSLTALYFLIFSALVNIILDFFITQLHLGVQSAGLVTIISQGLSAILCLYYIKKKVTFLLLHKSDFVLDSSLYLDLFGQGMAMGLMNSIVSIGTVTLQYAINGFCPLIISAQVAARRIMSFAVLPLTSLAAGWRPSPHRISEPNSLNVLSKGQNSHALSLSFGPLLLVSYSIWQVPSWLVLFLGLIMLWLSTTPTATCVSVPFLSYFGNTLHL